jgi:hypothetical protein
LLSEMELRGGMAKDTDAVSHSNAVASHGRGGVGGGEMKNVIEKCLWRGEESSGVA